MKTIQKIKSISFLILGLINSCFLFSCLKEKDIVDSILNRDRLEYYFNETNHDIQIKVWLDTVLSIQYRVPDMDSLIFPGKSGMTKVMFKGNLLDSASTEWNEFNELSLMGMDSALVTFDGEKSYMLTEEDSVDYNFLLEENYEKTVTDQENIFQFYFTEADYLRAQ